MKDKIKLAIADDHHLFRKGLIALLKEFDGLEIIIEAENGRDLLDQMKENEPDVVLLDIEMPVMDGIRTTEQLHKKFPQVRILILTMYDDEEIILHLIDRNAHGFLLKNNPIEMIVDGIHAVLETGSYFNDEVSQSVVKSLLKNKKIHPSFEQVTLSRRETQVMQMICLEYTNREIADKLCISVRTVDGHREKILGKINAKNTAGIVMYAVKNKLFNFILIVHFSFWMDGGFVDLLAF